MDNMKKPEWFELADNDRPAKQKAKASKSAFAVVTTLALTSVAGWGFMTNDAPHASATETSTISVTSVQTPPAPSPSSKNEVILPPTSKGDDDRNEKSEGKKSKKSEKSEKSSKSESNEHESGDDD